MSPIDKIATKCTRRSGESPARALSRMCGNETNLRPVHLLSIDTGTQVHTGVCMHGTLEIWCIEVQVFGPASAGGSLCTQAGSTLRARAQGTRHAAVNCSFEIPPLEIGSYFCIVRLKRQRVVAPGQLFLLALPDQWRTY